MIRKRLVSLCIILFGLSILTFGLTYLLPSDPVEELITSMGGSHDPEIVEKLEEQYGTSRPFFVAVCRLDSRVWCCTGILGFP